MSFDRLNEYHIMWLFVFFDLPVTTKTERKMATKFRKQLMENGFSMMQFSVYMRHCGSYEAMEAHKRRVRMIVPDKGEISMLGVTDKQFGDMEHFCSAQKKQMNIPTQLEIF